MTLSMAELRCASCGASDFRVEKGCRVCNYCDTKYEMEVKKPSCISLDDDIAVLLKKCKSDPRNARKYANLILDIDPTNKEAMKYI